MLFECKDESEWTKTHLVLISQYQNYGFQLARLLSWRAFYRRGSHCRALTPFLEGKKTHEESL